MTAQNTKVKVRLVNDFHNSSVNVIGDLIGDGKDCNGGDDSMAFVRLTFSQYQRAKRALCGADGCLCHRHGPSFDLEGDAYYRPSCRVMGERV